MDAYNSIHRRKSLVEQHAEKLAADKAAEKKVPAKCCPLLQPCSTPPTPGPTATAFCIAASQHTTLHSCVSCVRQTSSVVFSVVLAPLVTSTQ